METIMIKKWAARTANHIAEIIASLLMRSAIKPLLRIDERSLFDVGLSRSDVIECLATPLTTSPGKFLASRARRRGRPGAAEAVAE
jgi:uncharacterized protein YjiS (DUF1127 family)